MPSDPSVNSRSEISIKTKPELRLRLVETGTQWYFLDDSGEVIPLDSSHVLSVDFGEELLLSIPLRIYNETSVVIDVRVRPKGAGTVAPTEQQRIDPDDSLEWKCGIAATPGNSNSWSITGSFLDATPLPDPTFKVRWKAHGDGPSSA